MRFYRSMLQRHLFAHGSSLTLLSKNPAFTPKIASLLQWFPDARFINLARNPLETMPSMMNYMAAGWKISCDPLEAYPHKKEFFEILNYYYKYPVEYFQDKPGRCAFLRYEDMVSDPKQTIGEVYAFLGMEISQEFNQVVVEASEKARQYRSRHIYSMVKMGLTADQIKNSFQEVFALYEFGTTLKELPEEGFLWQIRNWGTRQKQRRLARRRKRQKAALFRKTRIRLRAMHRSLLR